MELWLEIDGELLEFDVTRKGEDILVTHDGETHCAIIHQNDADYNVAVDGKLYELHRECDEPDGLPGDKLLLARDGGSHEIVFARHKKPPVQPAAEHVAKDGDIMPLMPGTVVEVHRMVSDKVEEGDLLLTIEAMKMLNEVRAPISGTISEINVKPGDSVARGALMMRIAE